MNEAELDAKVKDLLTAVTGGVWRELVENTEPPEGRRFYHYTSLLHLPDILASQRLTLTKSNIALTAARAGPDVLWLTREDYRGKPGWAAAAKGRVRITVVPDAPVQRFDKWAKRHGISAGWLRNLETAAHERATKWHVTEEPVVADRWIRIEAR